MDDLLLSCPEITGDALCGRIDAEITHEEFLFYRCVQSDDLDWILEPHESGYEMFCTACGSRFFQPRDRKNPASKYRQCPKCYTEISPKRWLDRARLSSIQFAYHLFQRGEGADMWLRSFQVTMKKTFECGRYNMFEYGRVLFQPGAAFRWTRGYNSIEGATEWKPVKTLSLPQWISGNGRKYESVFSGISMEEMEGSCLQYVPMDEVMRRFADPVPLLALWVKHPATEYVWKMGFADWLAEKCNGGGRAFRQVCNLRAATPHDLFPQLDKGELKLLRERNCGIALAAQYIQYKSLGVVERGAEGLRVTRAIERSCCDLFRIARDCGVRGAALRNYLTRQARRRADGVDEGDVLRELRDYLEQLNRLGIEGGDLMPHDLHEAHARLSERERRLLNEQQNDAFRARRKLLRWMRWKHGGLFIRPIDSADEIVREGENMRNCVAGYADRHAAGKTIILVLRRCDAPRESWHTVEIDPKTLTCRQCYGYHNTPRSAAAAAFMEAYLAHLKEVRRRTQLNPNERRRAA